MPEIIAYAYDAALHCPDCAASRFADFETAEDDEGNPVSPVFDSEESDSPDHCDDCGVFLENCLTAEGWNYLVDTIIKDLAAGRDESVAITTWAPHYGVDLDPTPDRWDLCEGAYCALADYHDGQGSRAYRRLSILTRYFRPSPLLTRERLSTNALAHYIRVAADALVRG